MSAARDDLEIHLAHLTRTVDELSEVVARQDREIARLTARVEMLMQREADRVAAGDAPAANQKPPHW